MTPTREFRPAAWAGPVMLAVAVSSAAFGCGILALVPATPIGFCIVLFSFGTAVLAALTGGFSCTVRVTVGPAGVAKTSLWKFGFDVPWADLRAWAVHAPPEWSDNPRQVWFRLAGETRDRVVSEPEVANPGFDDFVAAVRAVAGSQETRPPAG